MIAEGNSLWGRICERHMDKRWHKTLLPNDSGLSDRDNAGWRNKQQASTRAGMDPWIILNKGKIYSEVTSKTMTQMQMRRPTSTVQHLTLDVNQHKQTGIAAWQHYNQGPWRFMREAEEKMAPGQDSPRQTAMILFAMRQHRNAVWRETKPYSFLLTTKGASRKQRKWGRRAPPPRLHVCIPSYRFTELINDRPLDLCSLFIGHSVAVFL